MSLLRKVHLPDLWRSRVDDIAYVSKKTRDEYFYEEGKRKMVIYAELLGSTGVDIDGNSIDKWLPPHENEKLSHEDIHRILDKFCKYLDSKKISYSIRW